MPIETSMGLTKISLRTVKCAFCGMRGREGTSEALYWYSRSDLDPQTGHVHTWNMKDDRKYKCTTCGDTHMVMMHEDLVPHSTRCTNWGRKYRGGWKAPTVTPTPRVTLMPTVPAPTPTVDVDWQTIVAEMVKAKFASELVNVTEVIARDVNGQIEAAIRRLNVPTTVELVDRRTFSSKTMTGVHRVFPDVLQALQDGENVWMVGPAGGGKTTIAKQCAEALGVAYGGIGLSVTRPVSDILGYRDAPGRYQDTEFRRVYEHGGVFLFDECDNGNPNTLVLVNEAIDNESMSFPDRRVNKHKDCFILAGANTYGTGADKQYVGRMQLDASFLDRFSDAVVDYDEALEDQIVTAHFGGEWSDELVRMVRYIRALRQASWNMRLSLVIGVRASRGAARLLRGGMSPEKVIRMRVRKGISEKDWRVLNEGIAY
jgi:MoxR-like ATPase